MPIISLPTGKVIYLSVYEYYFELREEDVEEFFRSCIADDIGTYEENPFCSKNIQEELTPDQGEVEEI